MDQKATKIEGFFIGFIILGTMVILNLFIGVIMKGMDEMEDEMEDEMAQLEGEKSKSDVNAEILERLKIIESKIR